MSPSTVHHDKSVSESVSMFFAFRRRLNMGSLALAMLVALALVTAHGKQPETRVSTNGRDFAAQLAIRPCDGLSRAARQEVQGHEFIAKDFGNKVAPNR
jgi:hypothetical protein